MHYAPYYYVIPTLMTMDPPAGQKNVTVADGSKFQAGFPVEINDSANSEWNEVDSVAGNVVTMKNNLAHTYFVAKSGKVEGPDPAFMKGAFAAAFAIDFLYEAYYDSQFDAVKTDILAKASSLADWLLAQQCTDPARKAYGGFKSGESSTQYYALDACRVIPALLEAYQLTSTTEYLDAAKLAALTFLYNMQHQPVALGVHDKYYGGFARYVTITDSWSQPMDVECLYGLVGLRLLADEYDQPNLATYEAIMADLVSFLRDGLEDLWLNYDPLPSGDGAWHRVGLNNTEVYDDPISFALLGLYTYEAWSTTCQRVYNFVQTIRPSGQYPAYQPSVCWSGYIDVVTRFPACAYYDAVTTGILWKIRRDRDKPAYKLSMQIVDTYQEQFMNWGPLFTDYSPIIEQKAMANVSWLGRLFLNYEDPLTTFSRILAAQGESILVYPVKQTVETVDYGEPIDARAMITPLRATEVVLEAGYFLNDYLTVQTLIPVRQHDKIRRLGEDYEIQSVQPYTVGGQVQYYKSVARRLYSA